MSDPVEAFEPLWLEISTPSRSGADTHLRHRLHGGAFTIGRGYQNDLVLDDPYVSPVHVRLARDVEGDGQWWIEDLGSDNGTRDGAGHPVTRAALNDHATFTLGKTTLQVKSGAFTVAPALRLPTSPATPPPPARAPLWQQIPAQAIALLAVVVALGATNIWLKQTGEPKFTNYVYGAIVLPLAALAWAGAWALVTRIITAHGAYFRHVRIIATAMIAFTLLEAAFKYVDYAFALLSASAWESAFAWLLLAGLGIAHLRVIAPQRAALVTGLVAALVLSVAGIDVAMKNDRSKYQPPTIVTSLMPPLLPTKRPVAREALFERIAKLQPELEEERRKDPPPGAGFDAD